MTWLQWVALAAAITVTLYVGLCVAGAAHWAALIRTHTRLLESGSVGAAGRLPSPARFDARELEGLPAPAQRYFRAVLNYGQPVIAAATVAMTGTMNMSTTADHWKPFTSRQRVVTRRPGFLWDAQVDMFPGVPAHVEDSYIGGQGRLLARLLGVFTVASSHGGGEIARGEFMRYFAESPWYPTALLPSQGTHWRAVDDRSALATMADGALMLTLLFRFDDAGLIASVHADARGAGVGKGGAMVMLPWECTLSNYVPCDGMLIPQTGEAAWVRPAGRKVYFIGHVAKLRYEFLH